MVTLLVANGCSCTRGEELEAPEERCWPTLLARNLAVPSINLARDGASNRRIVRSTVDLMPKILARSGAVANDVLITIAWTELSRHEYHSDIETPESRNGVADAEVDRNWHRIGAWRDRHRPTRAFYKYLWDMEGQITNFVTDWLMLDAYLDRLGVKVRYCFARQPPEIPPSLLELQDRLDGRRVWGGLRPSIEYTLEGAPDWMPKGPGGHPLEDGHRWFAEELGGWLDGSLP